MRFWTFSLLCFSLLFGSPLWISEAISQTNDEISSKKINMAGRQRMLSQRIAKASCFISSFTAVPEHLSILSESVAAFDKTQNLLKFGDTNQNFPPETDPMVLKELRKLDPVWGLFRFASSLLIESHQLPGMDMDIIAELNNPALKQANHIVQAIERRNSNQDVLGAQLHKAINLAGRQRMLIQKSAKEFCFISLGLSVTENQEAILGTIKSFDQSLDHLIAGNLDGTVQAPPTSGILNELKRIKLQWLVIRRIMMKAAENQFSQANDFNIIANINEPLMQQMDDIVKLYVQYSHAQTKAINTLNE